MERRKFFKQLGMGAVAVAIAPEVVKYIPNHEPKVIAGVDPAMGPDGKICMVEMDDVPVNFTAEDIIRIWNEHRILIYEDIHPRTRIPLRKVDSQTIEE